MKRIFGVVFLGFLANIGHTEELRRFPDDFIFGVATASYQIEGAWNADDKGENIWDRGTHTRPETIADQSNGDIACDSYHNYKRDVEMLRELNVDAYRFSFSWPRILPTGYVNKISEAGIAFYNNYINEMLKYNIQPMATMYHWDLPQYFQELGGWTNPQIIDLFVDYAKVLFDNFGDRIKIWATFNEPNAICFQGYGNLSKIPLINGSGTADYMCYHNLLKAHAKTYHLYNEQYKESQKGKIGLAADMQYYRGETDSDDDVQLGLTAYQFMQGIYLHPIYSETGDYPEVVKELVNANSKTEGYARDRLPRFTDEEIEYIKGSADYLGVNHYTTKIVYINESTADLYSAPHAVHDAGGFGSYLDSAWLSSASATVKLDPKSMYLILKYVREAYNNPEVYITENGWPSTTVLDDEDRITYYRTHLNAVLDNIDEGSNIKGYMAWSLMDNFEWMHGYTQRFGLYQVDMEDPKRTRTPRKSAFVYKEIVRSHVIDPDYSPDYSQSMWIEGGH